MNNNVSYFMKVFSVALFLLFFALSISAHCETKVRVLIADGKKFKIPSKDERLERIGNAKGEAYLDGVRYKGNVEVWKGQSGLFLINELTLEEYIKGVVVGEMAASWEIEALKAQAVAARTYAIFQMINGNKQKGMKYHLTSSVLHQVFKGGSIPESISKAVDDTKGEIILFNGGPIIAYYHSTSGGITEEASEVFLNGYPYLVPVETTSELSPYHIWQRKIPTSEIETATQLKGIKDIKIESVTVSDRIKELRFVLEDRETLFLAKELRKNLGWDRLPSTLITNITKDGDDYVFEGRGYGHGVGMCQWTALDMAKRGMNYKEILNYFYPNTIIQRYEFKRP